jgi:putative DNA primase/helicase
MTWVNFRDAEAQILAAGILPDKDLAIDGRIQRWKTADSKGNEKPGWTRLREWQSKAGNRYVVGCYGIWSGNDDGYTKIELPKKDGDPQRPVLSDEDIAAAREAQKAAAKAIADERKREAKVAAGWAAQVWAKCATSADCDTLDSHEYLLRKQIPASGARLLYTLDDLRLPGIDDGNKWRLQKSVGALVVPMHDTNGNVCGIQFIFPAGHERTGKEFWPTGMAMGGSFGYIGHLRRNGVLLLTEGFATAASLAAATGQAVAYAFSANNLGKAAKEIRGKYKQLRILICADDDYLTEAKTGTNPGVSAAQLAASAIELADWIKPDFTGADGTDLRNGKKLTDFNDLYALTGLPFVLANQINAKLDALKWKDAQPVALSGNQGGGEGDGGKGRRGAMSVMPLDDIVARFVPLDDGTGKYVFDTWTNKIAHREQMICLLPAGVRGDDIKRHPVYVERGAYYLDQVGFDPSGADKAVKLNTWQGWPMEPKAGACDRILELLAYLCSGDPNADALYRWVLRWMAYPLQHPGAKMSSAIIMHGPQGTGKSTVWQCLAKIYGDYATVLNQRGLEDRFNSDWVDSKLFILAEEVVTRAEMWHIKNELKELISGEWIRVNPKNVAAYRQRNQVNGVFLSNENQPLPLDNDDRRHCVIYTPPAVGEEYYDEVHLEIERGGVAALYHYLMTLDLGDFHPKKRPPMTEAKAALIALSTPSEMRFALEWVAGELGLPVCPAISTDVYAAYLRWCRTHGESRPRPDNQFHGALSRMVGWEKRKARIYADTTYTGGTVPRTLVIPPLHAIDKLHAQTEGKAIPVWLTESAVAFADALGGGESSRSAFG